MSAIHTASLTVQVSLNIRRRPGRKTVVTPNGKANPTMPAPAVLTRVDPALLKALARAFRYQRMLDEGQFASITEMPEAEKLDRGYMGRLLQLTLLAPHLVDAILNGLQPNDMSLPQLLKATPAQWQPSRNPWRSLR